RLAERRDAGDLDPLAVAERPLAACGPPAATEGRSGRDAAHDATLALERDERSPDRDPAGEVLRAVDRVDDPAYGAAVVVSLFLAEDAFARPVLRDSLADHSLDGAVCVGDRRQVGLRLDVQVGRAEARHGYRVGGVCELERIAKIGVHVPSVTGCV